MYGTSKTDKDLVFSADALLKLEQEMSKEEQRRWPLVMRPGMALPASASRPSAHRNSGNSSEAAVPLAKQQQGTARLTWQRYFHSQLAGVYSQLFHMKVPQTAQARSGAATVEHDFVFVR